MKKMRIKKTEGGHTLFNLRVWQLFEVVAKCGGLDDEINLALAVRVWNIEAGIFLGHCKADDAFALTTGCYLQRL